MSLYTCITCRVAFADGDLQRTHYKTDWHRYNLKRKVADLSAVTADTFQQKVLAQKEKVEDEGKPQEETCTICSKHFSNHNQYDNHIQSKKHKENAAKQEARQNSQVNKLNKNNNKNMSDKRLLKDQVNMEIKSKMEAEAQEGSDERHSGSQAGAQGGSDERLSGGQAEAQRGGDERVTDSPAGAQGGSDKRHSGKSAAADKMDISDEEDDSDAESCDSWEENTIGLEECLFCSHISSSLEDNSKHMTVKHGFFIPDVEYLTDLEGLIAYLGEKVGIGHLCLWCNEKGKAFHSLQAVQKHMMDKGHCKMLHDGDVLFEYADFYDYRPSYPDYQPLEGATGGGEEAMDVQDEEEVKPVDLSCDGYELVLPSGSTVGHRSLQKYYRQNLPHRKELVTTKSVLTKVLAQYKALGWTGATGEVAKKRVKDLGFIQRLKSHHYTKIGVRANMLQRHFKNPNDPKK